MKMNTKTKSVDFPVDLSSQKPRLKAKEFVNTFYGFSPCDNRMDEAKRQALIAVDHLIANEYNPRGEPYKENNIMYWQSVKAEILKIKDNGETHY